MQFTCNLETNYLAQFILILLNGSFYLLSMKTLSEFVCIKNNGSQRLTKNIVQRIKQVEQVRGERKIMEVFY